MKKFVSNSLGGVDMYLDGGDTFIRLNSDDLKAIFEVQQKQNDVDFVKHQVWNWVEKQLEDDDGFFADFNSHLFSGDEISREEIVQKILSDEGLIQRIADEYRDILDDPATEEAAEWYLADEAIGNCVSIKDIMGEILREKHPKELQVGQWRVLLIEQGDFYGTGNNRVPWDDPQPLVEFYDMHEDKEKYPEGRFTTGRYYIHQLLNPGMFDESLDEMVEQDKGLKLNQVRSDWTVSPGDLNVIGAWIKVVYAKVQEKAQMKVADVIANAQLRSVDKSAPVQTREQVME